MGFGRQAELLKHREWQHGGRSRQLRSNPVYGIKLGFKWSNRSGAAGHQRDSLLGCLFGWCLGSGPSFAGSGEFGVEQVLREAPDVLPGRCEAEITAREVANTEITGDHGTSRRENDDEGLHDSIASLGLCFLSGTEMGDEQLPHVSGGPGILDFRFWILDWRGGLRAHVMLCHNHYDLMAFVTPGESPLRYHQDNRKVSHGHENVALMKEWTPQPGRTINLRAMPCGGNTEPNG